MDGLYMGAAVRWGVHVAQSRGECIDAAIG